MKTINIYITREQKQRLDRIRSKYKVSLSTLTGTVAYWLVYVLLHDDRKETIKELQEKYIQSTTTYKTSVKPREVLEVLGNEITDKSKFTSNALVIYLEHKIQDYVSKKYVDTYYAKIDKKLNETFDVYWDYNCSIRNQRRMIRQNKEYWKKALNED